MWTPSEFIDRSDFTAIKTEFLILFLTMFWGGGALMLSQLNPVDTLIKMAAKDKQMLLIKSERFRVS